MPKEGAEYLTRRRPQSIRQAQTMRAFNEGPVDKRNSTYKGKNKGGES